VRVEQVRARKLATSTVDELLLLLMLRAYLGSHICAGARRLRT